MKLILNRKDVCVSKSVFDEKQGPAALAFSGGGGARVSEIFRFYSFLVSSSTFLQENKGLIYMYNFW